jgi:hypothetical protein
VYGLRYSIENGYISRWANFMVNVKGKNSSTFLVENSKYIKFFEGQVNGTIPSDVVKKEMKDYILRDEIDTVVERLTPRTPKSVKL